MWFVRASGILLCVGLLAGTGCVDNNSLRAGLPCLDDTDCKSPVAQIFCNKEGLCEAQSCTEGQERTCYTGTQGCDANGNNCVAPCQAGKQTCQSGFWGTCQGQVLPQTESCTDNSPTCCNGKDDDCNGKIDDAFPATKICKLANTTVGAGGLASCENGQESCKADDTLVFIESKTKKTKLGSSKGTDARDTDEGIADNPTELSFNYNYGIGKTEVTQKQFQDIMGYNPSQEKGDNHPVTHVSWHEAAMYTLLLSQKQGLDPCFSCSPNHDPKSGTAYTGTCSVASKYVDESLYVLGCPGVRLPTEAEWEYAYRAIDGTGLYKSFYSGNMTEPTNVSSYADTNLEQIAWYNENSGGKPHPVSEKNANTWQLSDMSGNAAEWVFDLYQSSYSGASLDWIGPRSSGPTPERVYRGGHYLSAPKHCRGAEREKAAPTTKEVTGADGQKKAGLGFRIARTLIHNAQ